MSAHPTVNFIPNTALSVASNRLLISLRPSGKPQFIVKVRAASTGYVNSEGVHEHGATLQASQPTCAPPPPLPPPTPASTSCAHW